MKLTKSQLKQIIKEELTSVLNEKKSATVNELFGFGEEPEESQEEKEREGLPKGYRTLGMTGAQHKKLVANLENVARAFQHADSRIGSSANSYVWISQIAGNLAALLEDGGGGYWVGYEREDKVIVQLENANRAVNDARKAHGQQAGEKIK